MKQDIKIRKYEPRDRQAVRDIFWDTALMGASAEAFFDGREVISDALTMYFTDYEPESCFVAEDDGRIAGCLLGARDKRAADKITGRSIAPKLLRKAFLSGALFKIKNIRFIFALMRSALRREFSEPDVSAKFPAALHINLKKEYRGRGIGGSLIRVYCGYLTAQNCPGAHLATMSDEAGKFFSSQGFRLLHSGKRSYFHHILGRPVPLYIYGKELQ